MNLFNPETLILELVFFIIGATVNPFKAWIDKVVNSEKYDIAVKVFAIIDPIIQQSLKGEAQFTYTDIKNAIVEVSNDGITEDKIKEIGRFVVDKFKLIEVLSR